MKIFIAADHLGLPAKEDVIKHLKANGIEVSEIGLPNYDLDDYPDFAFKLGKLVAENDKSLGVLLCGNGLGMSIAANKVKGIRCARAVDTDDAFKARNHNGANVVAIGINVDREMIIEIVDTFISTKTPSLDRYIRRVEKIISYENGEYNEL